MVTPRCTARTSVAWSWPERLCCRHTDEFMANCALTVDPVEARDGWQSWLATHEASCGALF